MRRARNGTMLLIASLVVSVLAGCSAADDYGHYSASSSGLVSATEDAKTTVTCATPSAPICTKNVDVNGAQTTVLTTPDGHTLYYYTADTASSVACTDTCAHLWPPVTAPGKLAGNFGLAGMVAVMNGSNGAQLTYNRHPLYTYSADKNPADDNGEGIDGQWHAVTLFVVPLA